MTNTDTASAPLFDYDTTIALHKALWAAQAIVADVNRRHGWFDSDRTVGDSCMLIVTEVSELMEEYRDGNPDAITPAGKPIGPASEAADILVRLLDHCERYDIDLATAFIQKVAYNDTREYRHGGKLL